MCGLLMKPPFDPLFNAILVMKKFPHSVDDFGGEK